MWRQDSTENLLNGACGTDDRLAEWFVPSFGSVRFRCGVGMLFLPYTGMVLSFSIIGSVLAPHVFWDRIVAVVIVYILGLGIAAHSLDALGSKISKPWGEVFSKGQLWTLAISALVSAYCILIYYMVLFVPRLWVVAVLEGFFVFAYNLEWFSGKFHKDGWFAFSWGSLPVVMGFMMQTNRISLEMLMLAVSMGILSLAEIKTSRPYKQLKRRRNCSEPQEKSLIRTYEIILKCLSFGVISLGVGLLIWRLRT